VRQVTVDELVAALAGATAPLVVDVRELVESALGHIPDAAVLPRRRVEFRIESLVRDRATPLVTVDGGADLGGEPGARDCP
jgi:rhodanese-related sulfurtransferase